MTVRAFVNRTLNLKKIQAIGFDMDHTLVRYHSMAFEKLAHERVVEILVTEKGYPEQVRQLQFDPEQVIRGLVIDRKLGNILKLNLHGGIRLSRHGLSPIPYGEQKRMYRGSLIDLNDPNYLVIDTAFNYALGNLFAHLVHHKDHDLADSLPAYPQIAEDLIDALDQAHRDDSLKSVVAKDMDTYLDIDPELPGLLERYKRGGKKLFVLTNSEYGYTKTLLDAAMNPFLKEHDHWSELFDWVITLASKPRFFYDNLRFFYIHPETGLMANVDQGLPPGIYQGGCARTLGPALGLEPHEILYVGDHIYGDILRLKKDCAWRTALVVEELTDETARTHKAKPIHDQIWALMADKPELEETLWNLEDRAKLDGEQGLEDEIAAVREKIDTLDKQIGELIGLYQASFNPHWGQIMRIGNEESLFAGQVERYACVYAGTLADILSHSPRTYFRAGRRDLAHERIDGQSDGQLPE